MSDVMLGRYERNCGLGWDWDRWDEMDWSCEACSSVGDGVPET